VTRLEELLRRGAVGVRPDAPPVVVIPARNERANLSAVVGELRATRPGDCIVVVDDHSADGTADEARRLGCVTIELPFHLGYGGAVQAGVKYALRHGHPAAVTFDGDGQHDPADVQALLDAVAGGADLVLGSRHLSSHAFHGTLTRRAGRRLFSLLCRSLTGLDLTDPTSGLKALGPRGQVLFASARFPDRFPDADALVVARRLRLVIQERPARMRPSRNRHSMHDGHRAVAYTFNMLASLAVAAFGRDSDLHT
jgi:glycosyltransferase involved in cell wall biosynthesis